MLKIGICTNREGFEHYIEDLLGGILSEYEEWVMEEISVQTLIEQKGEKYLDYQIFCLDEQLFRQNGIGTVTYLSRIRPDASVLLFEGVEEQGISGIRYRAFAYQMKRMRQRELSAELARQWEYVNSDPRCLVVAADGKNIQIPLEQILYIESRNRKMILHTELGEYEYYEKMYVLEELLEADGFIRCHQSFMIAKRFVTDYNSSEIWMDQVVIPIGRKYKEQIQQAFQVKVEESIQPLEGAECVKTEARMAEKQLAAGVENPLGEIMETRPLVETRRTAKATEKQGVLIGVRGAYQGVILHFRPEEKILVGRDGKVADIVVNLPGVSRLHCVIVYHEKDNTYEVVDFSKNGTYLSGKQRLAADLSYRVPAGTEIGFGDFDNVYRLE